MREVNVSLTERNIQETENFELPDWFELIQTNREYYIEAYRKSLTRPLGFTWNWSAALVSSLWFASRKIYMWYSLMCIVPLGIPTFFGMNDKIYFYAIKRRYQKGYRASFYQDELPTYYWYMSFGALSLIGALAVALTYIKPEDAVKSYVGVAMVVLILVITLLYPYIRIKDYMMLRKHRRELAALGKTIL
jgi:hypothetical protein